jgi:hypothetical protein
MIAISASGRSGPAYCCIGTEPQDTAKKTIALTIPSTIPRFLELNFFCTVKLLFHNVEMLSSFGFSPGVSVSGFVAGDELVEVVFCELVLF